MTGALHKRHYRTGKNRTLVFLHHDLLVIAVSDAHFGNK
jgi:hypothetical protein